jgi:hypothetical protein
VATFNTKEDMSFFSEAKCRFLPVPEDERIETEPFLNACTEVVPFFGEYIYFTPYMLLDYNITYFSPKYICFISEMLIA